MNQKHNLAQHQNYDAHQDQVNNAHHVKLSQSHLLKNKDRQLVNKQLMNPQQIHHKIIKNSQKHKNPYLSKISFKDSHGSTSQNKFKQKFKQIISRRQNPIQTISPRNTLNTAHTFRITKGIKFSKAKRYLSQAHVKSNDPSPDQYKYQLYQKNRNSPKFSFGKQEKFFKTKKQFRSKTEIPGPGKYNSVIIKNNLNLTIPHSDRFIQATNQNNLPGVGQYQIQKPYFKHTVSIKFPQDKRKSLQNPSVAPAPNKYFIQESQMRSTNQSFNKQRKFFILDDKIPGVGQYSLTKFKQKHSPSARFPSSGLKDERYKKQQHLEPGPGQYDLCSVQKYKQKSKLTSVIFAKAKQDKNPKQLYPGPGNYHISQKRIKIKGGVLSGRIKSVHTQQMPGPGNYEPKIDAVGTKSISARIGKQERMKRNKELKPGPNDYHPQKAKIHFNSTGFAFPRTKRELF